MLDFRIAEQYFYIQSIQPHVFPVSRRFGFHQRLIHELLISLYFTGQSFTSFMMVLETDYNNYALLYRCGRYGSTVLGNDHLIVH